MVIWEYRLIGRGLWDRLESQSNDDILSFERNHCAAENRPMRQLETNLWVAADGAFHLRRPGIPSEELVIRMDPVFSLDEIELAHKIIGES